MRNKDLSYRTFFGEEKTHEEAFRESLKNNLVDIRMSIDCVSEKNFSKIDEIVKDIESNLTDEIYTKALNLYDSGKRLNYVSELIYDEHFLVDDVNENLDILKFKDYNDKNNP